MDDYPLFDYIHILRLETRSSLHLCVANVFIRRLCSELIK